LGWKLADWLGRRHKCGVFRRVAFASAEKLPIHQHAHDVTITAQVTVAVYDSPTFGNKEGLFLHVLALYAERGAPVVAQALSQPTAYGVIERLIRLTADADTDPSRPAGCLFVQGALSRGDKATKIRNELTTRRTAIEPILRERIERARVEGDESVEGVPQKVARYISTVV
jgi:hypothetical protein